MEEKRVYYKEFPCFQNASKKYRKRKYQEPYFELGWLPTEEMQQEMEGFIRMRGAANRSMSAILQDKRDYQKIQKFLQKTLYNKGVKSFREWDQETWEKRLKAWMMANAMPITRIEKNPYGTKVTKTAKLILYFRAFLKYLEPEDLRDEREKDIWQIAKLDIKVRGNPIYNMQTLNFQQISQSDLREEIKKAIYKHLNYENLGTVQGKLSTMRGFSKFLETEKPEVQSCADVDRDVLETYLIYKMTQDNQNVSNNNNIMHLRSILETVGKLYGYQHLQNLFLNTDIPPEVQPEFRVYSDEEAKRFNRSIVKLDVQIARCMIIHQMLGTRISDTLTLERDCLFKVDDHDMIQIQQPKAHPYKKPINSDLAALIRKAIEYTEQHYGETQYVFVDEKDPSRPLQYTTIKHKVLSMIQKENLRDDQGKYFKFNSHMFRHYYGVKLTEMHLDDWTLAKLLGHSRLHAVNHYRRMNNQMMADETRKIRDVMSDVIYANLEGWGAEYEQIR